MSDMRWRKPSPETSADYDPRDYWELRAETFSEEAYQRGIYWQHWWIVEKLRSLQIERILEVGCGFGRNLHFLSRELPQIELYGMDLSLTMLKEIVGQGGRPSELIFCADARAAPVKPRSFPVVLMHGLLMHVPPEDIERAIARTSDIADQVILLCEQNAGGRQVKGNGSVAINDFTFVHDYPSLLAATGFVLAEHRRGTDLDAFFFMRRRAKYDVPQGISIEDRPSTHVHRLILDQVPDSSEVLDVGCATGYLGEHLIARKGCTVDGIEVDREAANIAGRQYREVWVRDLAQPDALFDIHRRYDVILCPAVLEHLPNPESLLGGLRRLLSVDGFVIVTLPNIAHWSIRWNLLKGQWEYTDYGLLDRTHLRFFTIETARRLLEDSGFFVEDVRWSNIGFGALNRLISRLPRGRDRLKFWLQRRYPGLFAYEIVLRAAPRNDE